MYQIYFHTCSKLLELFIACIAGYFAYTSSSLAGIVLPCLIFLNYYVRLLFEGRSIEVYLETEAPWPLGEHVSAFSNWFSVALFVGCLVSIPLLMGLI